MWKFRDNTVIKALKKPKMVRVVQVDVNRIPDGLADYIRIREDDTCEVYNHLHNSWIKTCNGDYINVDDMNDLYPIDSNFFAENFDIVESDLTDSQ